MASAIARVAFLPFRLVWSLIKLLIVPVVVVLLTWWLLGTESRWFWLIGLVAGAYSVAVFWAWRLAARGLLRSMARGPFEIKTAQRRRPRRGRRAGR